MLKALAREWFTAERGDNGTSGAPNFATGYRRDIDGLRSLAVVPVILFHLDVPGFDFGFIGVDIFFVISGYLITTILQRDIDSNRLSILKFYERRIRRIAPALIVVLIATFVAALLCFIPDDFQDFTASTISAVGFFANVYFYLNQDYFNTSALLKPLLHCWSLAVEEQYYIVFPPLLALLSRFRADRRFLILASVAGTSLAFSVWQTHADPAGAFYLPFSRMWELLLGSLLALAPTGIRSRLQSDVVGWIGILAIVASMAFFTEDLPFPGVVALLPCAGTLLILAAGTGSSAAVLGATPLRGIGLISYSLYLWHWPILAIYRDNFGLVLPWHARIAIILATFVCAYLSWRYVERPWRVNAAYWTRDRIFAGGGAMAALILVAAFGLRNVDKHFERFPPEVARFAFATKDRNPLRWRCDTPSLDRLGRDHACVVGHAGAKPSFAVVGDSIGDALLPGVAARADELGRSGFVLTAGGCSPLFDVVVKEHRCVAFYSAASDFLLRHRDVTHVIFIGRWATMVEGGRFGETTTKERFMRDAETVTPGYDENPRVFARAMNRMADRLKDRHITVIAFVPEQPFNVPRTLSMEALHGEPLSEGVSRNQHDRRNARTADILRRVSSSRGFKVIDFGHWACNERICPVVDEGGHALYVDDNHPSRTATLAWRDAFSAAFN